MTEASDNEIPEKKKKEEEEEESTLSVVVGNQGLTATTSSSSATASTAAAAAAAAANSSATTTGKDTTDLDFVGTSHAVKKLFSIPYHSSNQPLCIAVHNLDGTLLIDDTVTAEEAEQQGLFTTTTTTTTPVGLPPSIQSLALALTPPKPPSPTHLSATSPSQQQQQQQQQSEAISLLSKLIQNVRLHEEQKFSETNSSGDVLLGSKAVAEYLEWNFQGMNMLLGSDASIVRTNNNSQNNSSEKAVAIRVEQVQHLKNLLAENQQPNTNPILQQQQQQPQRSYA